MTQRQRFSFTDRFLLKDQPYRVAAQSTGGVVLSAINQPTVFESLTFKKIKELTGSQVLQIDRGWFDAGKAALRKETPNTFLSEFKDQHRQEVLRRLFYCQAFLRLEAEKRVKRIESSVQERLHEIEALVLQFARAAQTKGDRKPRVGTKIEGWSPPCVRTQLTWLRKFERSGCSVFSLVPKTFRCGIAVDHFRPEVERLLNDCVKAYGSLKKPSKSQIARDTKSLFKAENEKRLAEGKLPLRVPSWRTVFRRISRLDPYHTYAARHGMDAANRKFALYETGIDAQFPLERVEIDEWRIDLMSILTLSGIWDGLSPEEKTALKPGRRWLYLAIDHATRCVVGIHLSESQNSNDAVKVLEQITLDKSDLAAAAGCESKWFQYGGIGSVSTDQGPAFMSDKFQTAVLDSGGTIIFGPAGVPMLRGVVERMFKTLAIELMPRLTGRTFSNPEERGDYPAEKNACLADDRLLEIFILFIVDVYHNKPHAGLKGETPANAWKRLAQKYGVTPEPCPHTRRSVFGLKMSRTVTGRGVRIHGVDYSCDELKRFFLHDPDKEVEIRIDPMDIGCISVCISGTWYPAPALQRSFAGVSMNEWQAYVRKIRLKHRNEAVLQEPVIAKALKTIDDRDRQAMLSMGLTPHRVTADEIERGEETLFYGLSLADAADIPDSSEQGDLFDIIISADEESGPPPPGSTEPPGDIDRPDFPEPTWHIEDD